jgi:S-adenosylmethionine:tRNA ribosyltransferase-isomerase
MEFFLNLEDFNFELPKELIATTPLKQRSGSKLLLLDENSIENASFKDLKSRLSSGDLLIVNDTKVLNARLHCKKESGGKVEIVVERILDNYHVTALTKSNSSLKIGDRLVINNSGICISLEKKNEYLSNFVFEEPVREVLEKFGHIPLPPYIKRSPNRLDKSRYQTVYAEPSKLNSVAAPTAGLHFDHSTFKELKEFGINTASITLDIGLGTFKPIKEKDIRNHKIHQERINLSKETIKKIEETKSSGSKVIAVGTTALRCLEAVAEYNNGKLVPYSGETDLYIYPGFNFKVVDSLITNFHLPRSSLYLLVCAFGGTERMKLAYDFAIKNKYRFFSYGDAMLIS